MVRETYLFRGFKDNIEAGVFSNKYLTIPRKPLHTPPAIHHLADDWFLNQFGYRFRSQSLFCYGSNQRAGCYGRVGVVRPVGTHVMCWSPSIIDLYTSFSLKRDGVDIIDILMSAQYCTFTVEDAEAFSSALASGNEIMLWCERFTVSLWEGAGKRA